MQDKSPKSIGTHIEEIQNFEKYCKMVYNPQRLDLTLKDVVETLKEKIEMSRHFGVSGYIPKFHLCLLLNIF
jgi:hypothetical protein